MQAYVIKENFLTACMQYAERVVYKYFEPAAWFLRLSGKFLFKLGAFFLHPAKRRDFYEDRFFAQRDKKNRFLSEVCGLESPRLVKKLYPQPLAKDNVLSKTAANTALAEVELVLRLCMQNRNSKNFRIIGINRGGVIVAEFLLKELGLSPNNLLSIPDSGHLPDFSGLDSCDIYLLDDIIRTGETIRVVEDEISAASCECHFFKISLVSASEDVDYCAWLSNNKKIEMPWASTPHSAVLRFDDYFDGLGIEQISESISTELHGVT